MKTRGFTLRIGGVGLLVQSDLPIIADFPQAYCPFVEDDAASGPDVLIHLVPGPAPEVETVPLFDTDGAWTMQRDADGNRHIVNTLEGEHLWTAIMNASFDQVTVHCGARLLRGGDIINPVRYPLDQIVIMYALAGSGIMLHACGAEIDGRGIALIGKSGAGKSTISRLLDGQSGVSLLSDDRVVVTCQPQECSLTEFRVPNSEFVLHGTPWHGDAGIAESRSLSFDSMLFLSQSKSDRLTALDPLQSVERMLPCASIPWHDIDVLPGVLGFCDELTSGIQGSVLDFRPSERIVQTIRNHPVCV